MGSIPPLLVVQYNEAVISCYYCTATRDVVRAAIRNTGAHKMNVNLDYESGQSYSQFFSKYKITVSGGGSKRIRLAFKEQGDSRARLSLSLPREKAAQVAHAMLAAASGIDQSMECSFEEPKPKTPAA